RDRPPPALRNPQWRPGHDHQPRTFHDGPRGRPGWWLVTHRPRGQRGQGPRHPVPDEPAWQFPGDRRLLRFGVGGRGQGLPARSRADRRRTGGAGNLAAPGLRTRARGLRRLPRARAPDSDEQAQRRGGRRRQLRFGDGFRGAFLPEFERTGRGRFGRSCHLAGPGRLTPTEPASGPLSRRAPRRTTPLRTIPPVFPGSLWSGVAAGRAVAVHLLRNTELGFFVPPPSHRHQPGLHQFQAFAEAADLLRRTLDVRDAPPLVVLLVRLDVGLAVHVRAVVDHQVTARGKGAHEVLDDLLCPIVVLDVTQDAHQHQSDRAVQVQQLRRVLQDFFRFVQVGVDVVGGALRG